MLIELFADRLKITEVGAASRYVGYVMAHEITHILQGVARHSEGGIMKAEWDALEQKQISILQLTFDQEDIDWIKAGIEKRNAGQLLASR